MTELIADRRDIDFILYEQLHVEDLFNNKRFASLNRKTVDLVINEARNFAINELLPTRKPGDQEGARFENGKVFVPESFHRAHQLLAEGGWLGVNKDLEWGGQQMPSIIDTVVWDYFIGANFPFTMFPGGTPGAGKLIETFGTPRQKELFLKKLYSGEWYCTMVLTEERAGSDIGELTTKAVKNHDGTYSITGSKIFISGAEQDLTDNIVHSVLARIEGAPEGSRGVSLFLVPKYWVNDDGTLGDFNNVVCTGIEEKTGLHGSPTCAITLGEKGPCRGALLGEENRGLNNMFVLLNETRLLVGKFGLGCASASYLNTLDYARTRIQGKSLLQANGRKASSVSIIQHPDIRRLLLTMKTFVEGIRSFIYYISYCEDRIITSSNRQEKQRLQGLIDLLTPIAKAYATGKGFEMCNHGIQIHGGYGYTAEYPVEQLLRDCRVTMIYEGANGIQAIDLLKRKVGMNNGDTVRMLFEEIQPTIDKARNLDSLVEFADQAIFLVEKLKACITRLRTETASPRIMNAFAFASPLLEVFGDTMMAWMLLWRATVATEKIKNCNNDKSTFFYQGVLQSTTYFYRTELPVTVGKMNAILTTDGAAIEITDESFGG